MAAVSHRKRSIPAVFSFLVAAAAARWHRWGGAQNPTVAFFVNRREREAIWHEWGVLGWWEVVTGGVGTITTKVKRRRRRRPRGGGREEEVKFLDAAGGKITAWGLCNYLFYVDVCLVIFQQLLPRELLFQSRQRRCHCSSSSSSCIVVDEFGNLEIPHSHTIWTNSAEIARNGSNLAQISGKMANNWPKTPKNGLKFG